MKLRWVVSSVVGPLVLLVCTVVAVNSALAQAGAPVPEDSPLYRAFTKLKSLPAYHITMNMHSNDPSMAQMAAMGMGMGPVEKVVKGDTTLVVMHMKLPATDMPGTVDDWEIRAVAQNGRAARMFSSPAIPRLMKLSAAMVAMQLAIIDQQASMAVTHALSQGPMGAMTVGMVTAGTSYMHAEAPRMLKKEEAFFGWKCVDSGGGNAEKKTQSQLTDLKTVGDETVNGTATTAYEFYANDGKGPQGPIRLYVAKDSGLPLRVHMDDPGGRGSMDMDYSFGPTADIEVPGCLAK
jgi:hypothetical protein